MLRKFTSIALYLVVFGFGSGRSQQGVPVPEGKASVNKPVQLARQPQEKRLTRDDAI